MSNEIINTYGQLVDAYEFLLSAKKYMDSIQTTSDDVADNKTAIDLAISNVEGQIYRMDHIYPQAKAFIGAYRLNKKGMM